MSLKSLYDSYKQSTKYTLAWLWSQIEIKPSESNTSFRNTTEIISAANEIRQRRVPVPASVLSNLSSAIKKRKAVMGLFQGAPREVNASHKAFIEKLEQVIRILAPLKAVGRVRGTTNESPSATNTRGVNVFASLGPELDKALENDQVQQIKPGESVSEDSDIAEAAPVLDDDEFGQWIELSIFIYELDTLLECINKYWEEAAQGMMPIALAAALSTFALHAVDRISQGRARIAVDATEFTKKWMSLKPRHPKLRFTDMPELTCWEGGLLDDQTEFHHVHQVINHMRTMDEYRVIVPSAGNSVSPIGRIVRTPPLNETAGASLSKSFDEDDWALDQMQESMRQLLQTGRAIAKLELPNDDRSVCEALLPLIRCVEINTASPIPICLVFGMEMLLSTFKAFMWPEYTLNKTNCRLKVLMFAKEVKNEIETTIQEMKARAGSQHDPFVIHNMFLEQRMSDMDDILKEKRFDLYYQAPWTAGCHMNEILDAVRYDGSDLCFRTGYLCAVLHLYNALRAMPEPIATITLLERLCLAYKDLLFLGILPTENFSSHYRRASGKGFGRNQETGKTDYSRLSASHRGSREQQSMHICLFSNLHNTYYQPDITFWMETYSPEQSSRPTESQKRSVIDEVHSKTFNVALDKVKHRFQQDFQGDLPLARLNYFAIFRFCLKVLSELGSILRPQSNDETEPPDCSIGASAVDYLLEQLAEHIRDDNKKRLMQYWRPFNFAKRAFKNVGNDLNLQDFLWTL